MWCAVSVDGRLDVNVALNRPAYQSSLYSDAYDTYHPGHANDGSHGSHLTNGPCAHTLEDTNPWWAVDLGVALYVVGVKFTNRNGWGTYAVNQIKSIKQDINIYHELKKLTVSQLTVCSLLCADLM